jgi:single-stranded DNA-binding protein
MGTKNEKKFVTEKISGYLGQNPETTITKNNHTRIAFSIASHPDEKTVSWTKVQIWPEKDEVFNHEMKKGDFVELKGYFKEFETESGLKKAFIAMEVMNHKIKTEQKFKWGEREVITGNLGQTPEIKEVKGKDNKTYEVAVFSIASHPDNSEVQWTSCQVWNNDIEENRIEELGKGDFVEVKGLRGKEYQTKSGEIRRDLMVSDITVLRKNPEQNQGTVSPIGETVKM